MTYGETVELQTCYIYVYLNAGGDVLECAL